MCLLKINQTKYCTSKTEKTSVSYTLNDKNDNANTSICCNQHLKIGN